ncbi:AraC family transcriptional regulator [Fluviicola taffensis]|uniref:helix-turn-helix domain-containing protein n=1 Tax=Fluviicola taffensis TaxID=191579 RepID=UPI00313798BC
MKLFVKHMVSLRCKMVVKEVVAGLGLRPTKIELGMVEIRENISEDVREKLKNDLSSCGLELLEDRTSILIEQIIGAVIELVHYSDEAPKMNYSDYISEKLNYDYTYLSNVFSKEKGMTIQQFIIMNRVERVKEFLLYDELNLTEISYKMNYSSVAHLSNQFKKITGFSPSFYKQLKFKRCELDMI